MYLKRQKSAFRGLSVRRYFNVIFISVFCLSSFRLAFGQQMGFGAKENAMLMALENIQQEEKEKALSDSLLKAQEILQTEGQSTNKRPGKTAVKRSKLHPHAYFTNAVSLVENVDAASEARKSIVNNSFTPGIKMDIRDRGKRIAFDLSTDNVFYSSRRYQNNQSLAANMLANFNINRYTLSIAENYSNNYIGSSKFGVDDDRIANNWANSLNLLLARHFNRIGFDLGLGRSITRYESVFKADNTTDDTFTFNQYLQLASKTRLLFGYGYNRSKFDLALDPNDSHSNNFNLALTGVVSRKISAIAEMGYLLTDTKTSDARDTTLSTTFGYRISRRLDLSLGISHAIHEESTRSNYSISDNIRLSGNRRLAFNPKINLSFSGGLATNCGPKKPGYTLRERTCNLGLGVSYAFRRWLDFDFDWSQERKYSNVNTQYIKNTCTFTTQAKF